jgi:hypothetical protein
MDERHFYQRLEIRPVIIHLEEFVTLIRSVPVLLGGQNILSSDRVKYGFAEMYL